MNYLIFYIIHSIFLKNQKLKEIEIVKLREQYLEQYIENAETQYDSMRKIRHDIKDKYTTIYSLIKDKKFDEAEDFIINNFDMIEHSAPFIKTDNNIVNAIVNAKLTVASTLGINISCITVSSFDGINELDLCDLLSNTLENAITACKDMPTNSNKFICLEIGKENNIYSFMIKNSLDKSVISQNPTLKTTKKDQVNHGLGISIIRDIVNKYNGRYDYYEINNTFCCSIILKT
ncbi:MAG: ATP-binding protein [Ruminococcus sp.]|uniref:sensor histidine kinase n=1 Tax=Ruminococcus sp. TaxID=41978 RepID=UPI002600AEBD|nr:ATP-binding protein [Ruminococcus sp.]MCR5541649.1 ATP-binding protein [Ruminococcus sp.]